MPEFNAVHSISGAHRISVVRRLKIGASAQTQVVHLPALRLKAVFRGLFSMRNPV
jgi:hypothetical protein